VIFGSVCETVVVSAVELRGDALFVFGWFEDGLRRVEGT